MNGNDDVKNCEAYREAIMADPSFDGGGMHLAECEECQALRVEMQALDAQIIRALTLPVPPLQVPDLPPVESANVTALPERKNRAPVWFALAATVALAAVIGVRMFGSNLDTSVPLAEQIVAHLEHEKFSLQVTDVAVSDDRLARIVPANVATLDRNDGLVSYAQSCVINGHSVPHLVFQGERGPVTILLMPDEQIGGPERIESEFFNGVILPVGNGSIAIVGEDGEDLLKMEEMIKRSVTWDSGIA